MPTNITIIQTQDFIRAAPDGALDLTASRDLLKDLVRKFDTAGQYHVLVDTRGAEVRLSIPNIFELGVALAAEPVLARQKVALLAPPEEQENAEFFETVGINRGANLRVFTDFETAITWLVMNEQP